MACLLVFALKTLQRRALRSLAQRCRDVGNKTTQYENEIDFAVAERLAGNMDATAFRIPRFGNRDGRSTP
jgi:hypothetical protein